MSKPGAKKLNKIGLVIKHSQPAASELAVDVAQFALSHGLDIYFASDNTELPPEALNRLKNGLKNHQEFRFEIVPKRELPKICDLIVVLGGDGTFLSIARLMVEKSIPILGVNMGQLGFLTEFKSSEAIAALDSLLKGSEPNISERLMLEVTLTRKNEVIYQGPIVNDVVISKGAIARIIGMEISVDGHWMNTTRADGIIVATPTGSTAYALAAHGPIVAPTVPAMILAPICPHSLTLRPVVLPSTSEIKICLLDRPGHVLLTLDGQDAIDLLENDLIHIRKFKKHCLKLVSSPSRNYFSLLREKLKFGVRD